MKNPITSAINTIKIEQDGLDALTSELKKNLKKPFADAIKIIQDIKGRVVVSGMGKSGHVSAKIAATLASTGTPAFFVHPSEANHGDLGMIAKDDAILALSWSGETTELHGVLEYSKRFGIPLIAVTAGKNSTLAKHADILLTLPQKKEACPHNLAPTTSSIMMLAIGDAIALALLESKGFSSGDFGVYHPGGQLGAKLMKVSDVMHKGDALPIIKKGSLMTDAIMQMSAKGFGCVGVVDKNNNLCGIITDGDLRRNLNTNLLAEKVEDIMTKNPKTVQPDMLATAALGQLNKSSITALMVTKNKKPVGLLHFHDLLRIGVA